MGSIFQPVATKVRILQGEKTSFPLLRKLPAGDTADTFAQGEWVGLTATGGAEVALKVSAANEVAQAVNALIRINDTTNDVNESEAITCQQGFFRLETSLYKSDDTYAAGDRLTVRFVSGKGGVLAAKNGGTTTHYVAQVVIPPTDASSLTPMTVLVFAAPLPV
jgi:hypothetical protein